MSKNPYNGFSAEVRARSGVWLTVQYKARRVQRPKECQACSQHQGVVEHHAEDYSEPFGPHIHAFALCFRCHLMVHSRFRNPVAWERYCDAIARGVQYAPSAKRDYFTYIRPLLGRNVQAPFVIRPEGGSNFLREMIAGHTLALTLEDAPTDERRLAPTLTLDL
jgi:hypothetical protein